MAILAHLLQLVGWWIAPLIIFLIKRDSKFVSFHALQALLLQAVYVLVMIMFAILWFITIFATMAHHNVPGNAPRLLSLFYSRSSGWVLWGHGLPCWFLQSSTASRRARVNGQTILSSAEWRGIS